MDHAIASQFSDDQFVTVQMAALDVGSGRMHWVNAGHPHPLLLRGHRIVRTLESPTTLPLGFGGVEPAVSEVALEPGDRVLFYTDGITEQHVPGGQEFGEDRFVEVLQQVALSGGAVQETVRRLSHALRHARGDATNDDATLFLVEWRGGSADHLADVDADAIRTGTSPRSNDGSP
jgi:serine phosphatase RsbU (regulator of sigma subunit)